MEGRQWPATTVTELLLQWRITTKPTAAAYKKNSDDGKIPLSINFENAFVYILEVTVGLWDQPHNHTDHPAPCN